MVSFTAVLQSSIATSYLSPSQVSQQGEQAICQRNLGIQMNTVNLNKISPSPTVPSNAHQNKKPIKSWCEPSQVKMNHAQLGASSETFGGHLQSIYWVRISSQTSFIVFEKVFNFSSFFNLITVLTNWGGRTKISDQKNDLKKKLQHHPSHPSPQIFRPNFGRRQIRPWTPSKRPQASNFKSPIR